MEVLAVALGIERVEVPVDRAESSTGFGPKTSKRRSRASSIVDGLTVGTAMLVSDGHGATASASAAGQSQPAVVGPRSGSAAIAIAPRAQAAAARPWISRRPRSVITTPACTGEP